MMIYAVVLSILGLLFIFFEFFLPGGILAVLGACALVSGVVLTAFLQDSWLYTVGYLTVSLVLSGFVCYLALYRIKKSAKHNSFFLSRDQEGFTSSSIDPVLIGKIGVAESDLRPSGHILIDNNPYQAMADRGYITKGEEIRITSTGPFYYIVTLNKE
ncbi:MAG: serine protease [Chlamydiae bacterium]|nr:serine protease [Chlamydiota bacterium]